MDSPGMTLGNSPYRNSPGIHQNTWWMRKFPGYVGKQPVKLTCFGVHSGACQMKSFAVNHTLDFTRDSWFTEGHQLFVRYMASDLFAQYKSTYFHTIEVDWIKNLDLICWYISILSRPLDWSPILKDAWKDLRATTCSIWGRHVLEFIDTCW